MSFEIQPGETYGLVGESGCGKTTTGRAVIGLNHVTSGEILFEGKDLAKLRGREKTFTYTRYPNDFPRSLCFIECA